MEILKGNSSLAAAFLSTLKINLDPQLDTKWLTGMAAIATILQLQGCLESPFKAFTQRYEISRLKAHTQGIAVSVKKVFRTSRSYVNPVGKQLQLCI